MNQTIPKAIEWQRISDHFRTYILSREVRIRDIPRDPFREYLSEKYPDMKAPKKAPSSSKAVMTL